MYEDGLAHLLLYFVAQVLLASRLLHLWSLSPSYPGSWCVRVGNSGQEVCLESIESGLGRIDYAQAKHMDEKKGEE